MKQRIIENYIAAARSNSVKIVRDLVSYLAVAFWGWVRDTGCTLRGRGKIFLERKLLNCQDWEILV